MLTRPTKWTDALRIAVQRQVVALDESMGTQEIQTFIPAALRAQSFYSARTPYVSYLTQTKGLVARLVRPSAEVASGDHTSPAQVRAAMKQHLAALGYQPKAEDRGGLKDLSSDMRVNLIIDTQVKMNRGYGNWRASQDEDVLDLYPADELYRAMARTLPRDWQVRWNEKRGQLASTSATEATGRNGPFVALKNDPIWTAISTFGNPYPPFDYRSGMRVRDVNRKRALELGVLKEGQRVEPVKDPLIRPMKMQIAPGAEPFATALQTAYGSNATLQGDALYVIPDPKSVLRELLYRANENSKATGAFSFLTPEQRAQAAELTGTKAEGWTFGVDADHIRHILQVHGGAEEKARGQKLVSENDIYKLPEILSQGVLREPKQHELHKPGAKSLTVESGDWIVGLKWSTKSRRMQVATMYNKKAGS
ncbi:MAG: hypothetical protein R6X19_08560 [Kiritimatiellia bacterium]